MVKPAASWPRFCRSSSIRGIRRETCSGPDNGVSAEELRAVQMINRGDPAFVVEFVHAVVNLGEGRHPANKKTAITVRIEGIIRASHLLTRNHSNLPREFHNEVGPQCEEPIERRPVS